MDGIARTGVAFLDPVTDQNWKMIVGSTDLNNDGKPNILWRSTATGANMVWYMEGIASTAVTLDTVTDQNMEIAGQGNYSAPPPPPPPTYGQCGSANGGTFTTAPTTNLCSAGLASAVSGTGPWAWVCAGLNGGTNASCSANLKTWIVTPSAVGNGTISPNTQQTVNHGTTKSFTITPTAGYTASMGGTCGGSPSSGTAPFTYITASITANCTVTATFTQIVVGACGSANGSTVASAPTTNLCSAGTASAVSGTGPWTWTCQGTNNTAQCQANPLVGVCGSANGGVFTSAPTTNLCSAGTASAVSGTGPWTWVCQGANSAAQCQANPATWNVTSSVTGGNGTISCTSPVNHGLASACAITPNKGYRLGTLTDNGSDVTSQAVGNVFTIPTVTTNHAVVASFVTRGPTIIFWRDSSTGENRAWFMEGSTRTATATLNPLPGAWRMVGTADFNNDGEADILWRNFATGANMVWYMNGAARTGTADIGALTDPNWKIVGVGNFNSDGTPDIVWRNVSTGASMVWYMNGVTHIGTADLPTVTDQNWKIVGTADFNSDGNPDIVWRSSTTGQNAVWYMEGTSRVGVGLLDSVTDQNWKMIVGTTDLNNDKKLEILWRNSATGANMVWYMNGVAIAQSLPLDTEPNLNLEMAGQNNN
jgi:hypothetical protein